MVIMVITVIMVIIVIMAIMVVSVIMVIMVIMVIRVLVLVLDSLLNKTSKRIELKLYIAYLELYPTGNNHLESILGRVHFDHGQGVRYWIPVQTLWTS